MIAHYAHGVYSHYAQSVLKYMYTMHKVLKVHFHKKRTVENQQSFTTSSKKKLPNLVSIPTSFIKIKSATSPYPSTA